MEMPFKGVTYAHFVRIRCSTAPQWTNAHATVCITRVRILCAYAKLAQVIMEMETAQYAQRVQQMFLVVLKNAPCVLQDHGSLRQALVVATFARIKLHLHLLPPALTPVYVFVAHSLSARQTKHVFCVRQDVSKTQRVQIRVFHAILDYIATDWATQIALRALPFQQPDLPDLHYPQIVFAMLAQKKDPHREHVCHALVAFKKACWVLLNVKHARTYTQYQVVAVSHVSATKGIMVIIGRVWHAILASTKILQGKENWYLHVHGVP